MYYFAYGSCMHEEDFRRTVNEYTRVGKAELRGYKLGFTYYSTSRQGGVADIVESVEGIVEGILYEIAEKDALNLDHREGHPIVYRRKWVEVILHGEIINDVLTYQVVKQNLEEIAPTDEYAQLILHGAVNELNAQYLQSMKQHIHRLQNRS